MWKLIFSLFNSYKTVLQRSVKFALVDEYQPTLNVCKNLMPSSGSISNLRFSLRFRFVTTDNFFSSSLSQFEAEMTCEP